MHRDNYVHPSKLTPCKKLLNPPTKDARQNAATAATAATAASSSFSYLSTTQRPKSRSKAVCIMLPTSKRHGATVATLGALLPHPPHLSQNNHLSFPSPPGTPLPCPPFWHVALAILSVVHRNVVSAYLFMGTISTVTLTLVLCQETLR